MCKVTVLANLSVCDSSPFSKLIYSVVVGPFPGESSIANTNSASTIRRCVQAVVLCFLLADCLPLAPSLAVRIPRCCHAHIHMYTPFLILEVHALPVVVVYCQT